MENVKYDKKYFEQRRAELKNIFDQIKPDLQDLADYFAPNAVRFIARNINKPHVKSKKILDSTTFIAVRNFASGMMTGATSPTRRWFKTGIMNRDNKKNKMSYAAKLWCSNQAELSRKILYASNFYQLLPEVYEQLGVFLFSCMAMEKDYDNVANFKVLPIGSYYYSKDGRGVVDTVCRNYMESAKNLVERYGLENCSDAVQQVYKTRPNDMFEIVHFVEPNREYKEGSPISAQKKFISVTYEVGNGTTSFLKKAGFDKFPYVVFEASCNGEDAYPSKGCGIYALPDAKQLMSMIKELGKAVKKMVSPAYQGSASLKNKRLSDNPGFFNEDGDNGAGIRPIHEVNPQVLELKNIIAELRENIKSIFYNDLFAMILNTAERGRTATEVNELKEEKLVLLSPLLEQIHTALKQILDWLFYTEMEAGILPEVPQELEGEEIEIEFISTLAQAMKAQNISSMERFITFTANMAQAVDPVLIKKIKGEKMIDDYADFANIDPNQIAPNEELEALRQQQAEKQAQAEQMQQLQAGSEMIKNIGGSDSYGAELLKRLGMG
nr:MAG TPA: head to tail connecting protein [Caudoviricetes sp.]